MELQFFHSLKSQIQYRQNKKCFVDELEVTHAGLTETEILPTQHSCFASKPP